MSFNEREKIHADIKSDLNFYNSLTTEYRIFKEFVKEKMFIMPQAIVVGEQEDYRRKNGVKKIVHIPITAQFIPIKDVLKLFFELPGVYQETSDYVNELSCDSPVVSNFVQSKLWKNCQQPFVDREIYPIFLHFDDYENNNPLGTHRGLNKCGAIYL